ncbi:hypothetical protein [Francisella salimarina]|uniref:hypothetical protein n=1 Tax=Francisella salimarina TaxID=2599927 RepID=UPI0037502610
MKDLAKLKRSISINNYKISFVTERCCDYQYAFYLHHSDGVEKVFYSDKNYCIFDMNIVDGEYKAVFYYRKEEGGKHSYEIDFIVIDDEIKLLSKDSNKKIKNKKKLYKLYYRRVEPIVLFEDDWLYDGTLPNNFVHHIMSLRWLRQISDIKESCKILENFIDFHSTSVEKSIYYLGYTADHTASIRLKVLAELYDLILSDSSLKNKVLSEICKTAKSMLNETYKENNNHGLMVDMSIIDCLKYDFFFDFMVNDIQYIKDRIVKQLRGIFFEDGYTKEHSISYQEFNMGLLYDLKLLLRDAKIYFSEFDDIYEKCYLSTKKILGYALKNNGNYMPIGDSFDIPNIKILEKVYKTSDIKKALYPYVDQEGMFCSSNFGIVIYRKNKLHISLNAAWNSYVHKQNDDLGLNVSYDGEDFITEGGYSDIIDSSIINYKSEYLHSTVIPESVKWLPRFLNDKGYSSVISDQQGENVNIMKAKHNRANYIDIERNIVINDNGFTLTDKVKSNKKLKHRFLIPAEHIISYDDGGVVIKGVKSYLEIKDLVGSGNWSISNVSVGVYNNKKRNLVAVDYDDCSELCIFDFRFIKVS